jgi:hypothetical protein
LRTGIKWLHNSRPTRSPKCQCPCPNVWNQYVKEIGAPDDAIVSVAEIHNMRDGSFTVAQLMWARGNQTIWTIPNVYALGSDKGR